jgi:hypothetical protein
MWIENQQFLIPGADWSSKNVGLSTRTELSFRRVCLINVGLYFCIVFKNLLDD